jgi:hypothetical protein
LDEEPTTYMVRAANVNDKVLVKPLLEKASRLLRLYGKRISHFIADSQYYSEEVFKRLGNMELNQSYPTGQRLKSL